MRFQDLARMNVQEPAECTFKVKLIDFQTLQPAARIPREMAHSCGHATRCYEHCHPAAVAAATSALEAHEVLELLPDGTVK